MRLAYTYRAARRNNGKGLRNPGYLAVSEKHRRQVRRKRLRDACDRACRLGNEKLTSKGWTLMIDSRKTAEDRMTRAAMEQNIPHIYFHATVIGVSAADVMIAVERNGVPTGTLHISHSVAKTLAINLGLALADFEAETGLTLRTVDEIEALLFADKEENKSDDLGWTSPIPYEQRAKEE